MADYGQSAGTGEANQLSPTQAAIGEIAPKLAQLTDDVLFGDVWKRSGLSPRDRSLITLAALISLNRTGPMSFHFERALTNGVTSAELEEIITHLAFYAGWPCAMSAFEEARSILTT
ncbi:carboxymuconolactone decarboxylase family protein [Rhodococcus erythropolis]|uniref:carboxymuconolactone decarboxylase family protein n=1 Tax=Rhodococcus erythropolis TaxID=1833 RepID=UPI00222706EF|nr:carboxymuconolactone decarboxylase family protein [Rhodococcus erythropolis]MCW2295439.1 4-carboxymuconolactone decarboxylase [Rhodococcus erythropolis]